MIPAEIKFDANATPPQWTDDGEQVIEKGTNIRIKIKGLRSEVDKMYAVGTMKEVRKMNVGLADHRLSKDFRITLAHCHHSRMRRRPFTVCAIVEGQCVSSLLKQASSLQNRCYCSAGPSGNSCTNQHRRRNTKRNIEFLAVSVLVGSKTIAQLVQGLQNQSRCGCIEDHSGGKSYHLDLAQFVAPCIPINSQSRLE